MGKKVLIPPNITVLASTQEFFGGRNGITTILRARSSVGRWGITIAKCAGIGDVGFISKWVMSITNLNDIPVFFKIGMRIRQALFFDVGETLSEYKGKYLEENWRIWHPDLIIPKLWKDKNFYELR